MPIKTEGHLNQVPQRQPTWTYNLLGAVHNTVTEGRTEKRRPKHEAMSSQDRTAPPAQAWGHAPKEVRPAAGTHTYIHTCTHAYVCAHTNESWQHPAFLDVASAALRRPQCPLQLEPPFQPLHTGHALPGESGAGPSPPHSPHPAMRQPLLSNMPLYQLRP